MSRESHPAADIFPLMADAELEALTADIAASGLRQPIALDADGRVVDGRNRLAACEAAGVEPRFETIDGDPLAYSISANVQRRNLTAGQKAIAAAESRKIAGSTVPAAAEQFGVGTRYVEQATALLDRAPDAAAEVKAGRASLTPTYEALREAEEARDRDANVATAREEEAQRLRAALAEPLALDLDLLPAPTEEAIRAVAVPLRGVEHPVQEADERPATDAMRRWIDYLRRCAAIAREAGDLPPFPEDEPDIDLLRIQTADAARLLADAAAKIVSAAPSAASGLRRVQ